MFGGNVDFRKGREEEKPPVHGEAGDGKPEPGKGDGFHHHELHEHESGLHSKHTHPDGREEHADHADYQEATDHMHRMFGHGEQDEEAGESAQEEAGEGEDGSTPDFSREYSRG